MKIWTTEEIKNMISTSDVALKRGISAIYDRQTEDEKKADRTLNVNNIGFNSFDSEFLSSIAKQIKSNSHLTRKQIDTARGMMLKYSKQLTSIANKENKQDSVEQTSFKQAIKMYG